LSAARLALQELEVVIEPGCDLEAAVQARVAGDLVTDHDLAGADLRLHPQPDAGDRHRVTILADRDERFRVDARRRQLGRLVVLAAPRRPSPRALGSAGRSSAKQASSSSALSSRSDATFGTGTG